MDFNLTDEHQHIRAEIRRFAEQELAPDAAERDALEKFPHRQIRELGRLGYLGMTTSVQYGGQGSDMIAYAIVIEELSRVDASAGVIVSVNNSLVCYGLEKFGSEALKQKYLMPLARGERLGAYCLSEPGTGSDAGNLQTTAERRGNHYLINGTKNFITNGVHADNFIVFATLDKAAGHKGVSAFLVEKGMPGFSVGKKEKKLGIRSSDTAMLNFDNVPVPAENLIGAERQGFHIAMAILDCGRIGIAAQAVGIAQGALEAAVKYAKERVQFGRPLADFQAIQFMLAEMATAVEAARLLVYRAASLKDHGRDFSAAAAQAKLFASQVAVECGVKAVQIYGGAGYLKDYPVERIMRDARITEIYEGTSEIQKLVIARHLLK
ncbi:MAG: acyl-CoA dehydrogenase [candidate division KSB1 bacterium]|nr:acyl-CoA dehydrogenase [candidate division KSB1 bacterium]MDZ7275107.1 acyl-CoA dehydrogenase [candidate division KSB1 bacterium]MDZ7286445.1 acyl-CoA dehydrogenase [candidate division KSB1 bacterium]MDZ7299391.1 acyl-CoA dehydrogenase [candidate division KSB1 bacterium]MDZ7307831.1 acyl-CoA dehydrogenase [candidate division KSB1 bacterium]